MIIDAKAVDYNELNKAIKESSDQEIKVINTMGQRYIGSGLKGKTVYVEGVPGNAIGAYLNKSEIFVQGNCQDATGDTMNDGKIIVYGNCGDALGYSMRGGEIYVKGDAGYRVGIHMKEYKEQKPLIVVGGKVGSFLGEYQAGGTIIVLGIGYENQIPVGAFCGTGMHGGVMYIRADKMPEDLPKQVSCEELQDISEIKMYIKKYSRYFNQETYDELYEELIGSKYYKLTPNAKNPYKQLYVEN